MNLLPDLIQAVANPLVGSPTDYNALLDSVGDAQFVLLGEATHGTHEFYHERAQITKRLIREKGFRAVAVEADWPDAGRVHQYVMGTGNDPDGVDALGGFKRFPAWMWRNADVLDFIGWLRSHNDSLPSASPKTGFYGLDLYSLRASIEAVISYLGKVDPEAAHRARRHYSCFDHFGGDFQAYGYQTGVGLSESCEREVIEELVQLRRHQADYLSRNGRIGLDDYFFAEQNAQVVKDAEQYYRSMLLGQAFSWNLRDRHMFRILEALARHLGKDGKPVKIVVWAHNSHLGDARATQMAERGKFNLGQLVRERYSDCAVSIGFTTHSGTVTAASEWETPAERKQVRPALEGSYEDFFHRAGISRFWIDLRKRNEAVFNLRATRLERAIGVVYLPESERISHYFHARLPDQFDGILHFDQTRAVEPLERSAEWEEAEVPETYPTGI